MKNMLMLLLVAVSFGFFLAAPASAQFTPPDTILAVLDAPDAPTIESPAPDAISEPADPIAGFVAGIAARYPVVIMLLSIIGALRTVFKPLVTWYEGWINETPDDSDNIRFAGWKESWWFKALAFCLDFGASIKIKK